MSPENLMKFINEDSPKINGWFLNQDMISYWCIDFAQKQLDIQGGLCEVGVYEGKSLVLFANLARENEKIWGFDFFGDGRLQITQDNLSAYSGRHAALYAGDTAQLNMESLDEILAGGIRLLHIDAGHEYHEVVHQLKLFAPYVLPGGCIIMDDYQDREFPGIEAAVLDFCEIDRPRRFVPFFAGANKMYLCEHQMSEKYQINLLQHEVFADRSRTTRVRDFTVLVGFSKAPIKRVECVKNISSFPFRYLDSFEVKKLSQLADRYGEREQSAQRVF